MSSWAWWLIWGGLGLFSILYLGYIGFDLFGKATRAAKAIETAATQVEPLLKAFEQRADLPASQGNLLDDPAPLHAELDRNLKKRAAKRQDRQRRLINKLIDYNESEFKP